MKPAPFRCLVPESTEEVLSILAEHGDEARLLAGGQSLVPMMNLRLARAQILVDLNRVDGLAGIREEADTLVLGTMLRQDALLRAPAVASHAPLLAAAVDHVGYPATRSRGTVGGSAAHADPAAELPAALLALDASMLLRSARGERRVAADAFFVDYFTTALEPDEVLCEIHVPNTHVATRSVFLEVARRKQDFPICGVAAWLRPERGACADLRVALCSAAARPVRARAVEDALRGAPLSEEACREAALRVDGDIDPLGDVHGSAAYRRDVAATLTRRALLALLDEGSERAHA